jgi:hypothetical protein
MAKASTTGTQSDTMRRVAAEPKRPAGPRAIVADKAQGRKIVGNLGPGTLRPGAGDQVQQTRQALFCGTIMGSVVGYVQHPNSKDSRRTSTRFLGDFMLTTFDGHILHGAECYFPSTMERTVKASLDMRQGHGEPLLVSFDVQCEPDQPGRPPSPLKYSYVTYDRMPQRADHPLMALAYEIGLLERPQGQLEAPDTDSPDVDPETGEVSVKPSQAA